MTNPIHVYPSPFCISSSPAPEHCPCRAKTGLFQTTTYVLNRHHLLTTQLNTTQHCDYQFRHPTTNTAVALKGLPEACKFFFLLLRRSVLPLVPLYPASSAYTVLPICYQLASFSLSDIINDASAVQLGIHSTRASTTTRRGSTTNLASLQRVWNTRNRDSTMSRESLMPKLAAR